MQWVRQLRYGKYWTLSGTVFGKIWDCFCVRLSSYCNIIMFFVRLSSYWLHNVDHDHNNNDNDHHDQVNGLPLPLVALLPLHLQHPPHHQQHGWVLGCPGGDLVYDHNHDIDDHDAGEDAGLPDHLPRILCLLPRFPLHHCHDHCRHHHWEIPGE